MKREVKEEAGVDINPTKLLCVETTEGSWFRFTFSGPISGKALLPEISYSCYVKMQGGIETKNL